MLKKVIHKIISVLGYRIEKISKITNMYNLLLYEKLFSRDSIENKRFYNVGAGGFYHPLWTNVDYSNEWYKEFTSSIGIHYDLMKCQELPIDDCTAEIVYTSHTLEHITDKAIMNLFSETYRILKKRGTIRITAPDVNIWYQAFIRKDKDLFSDSIEYYSSRNIMEKLNINSMKEASIGSIFQYYFSAYTSPLTKEKSLKKFSDDELRSIFSTMPYDEALTYICSFNRYDQDKAGFHINWVNGEKVTSMLKQAGFSDVITSAYGQSSNPVLRELSLFDNTVPEWSFYIEAHK